MGQTRGAAIDALAPSAYIERMNNAPIPYMERTRMYYRALGYSPDYRWAQNDTAPFTHLKRPLKDAKIALITTSYPPGDWSDDNPPKKEVWSQTVADAPADLYNQNLAWDKELTHTKDRETYLPLMAMQQLAADGVIGGLTEHFHSVPTDYSHRHTIEYDAPNILKRLVEDGADAAILVPL